MQIEMIEPYPFFPVCSYPLFESVLRTEKQIEDLSYLYLGNTFEYSRAEEIKVIGDELNISFGTARKLHEETYEPMSNTVDSFLANQLYEIYGVKIYYQSYRDYSSFKIYIQEQLEKGKPVICQYNLIFTPTKLQYKKKYGDHTIMILGRHLENNAFICMEEGVNPYFELKEEDLQRCFEYNVSIYRESKLYIVKKELDRELDEHQLFCYYLERILEEEIEQKKTLEKFVSDMKIYLEQKTDKKKFTIPNLWTISLEKNTTIRWIEKYMTTKNSIVDLSKLQNLKEGIKEAADLWVNIVFLLERSMYLKEWKYSEKLKEKLDEVHEKENNNYNLWKALKEM